MKRSRGVIMMARSRKKVTKAPAKKRAATKASASASEKAVKKSALHKLLTAEGWRRLMMKKRSKSK